MLKKENSGPLSAAITLALVLLAAFFMGCAMSVPNAEGPGDEMITAACIFGMIGCAVTWALVWRLLTAAIRLKEVEDKLKWAARLGYELITFNELLVGPEEPLFGTTARKVRNPAAMISTIQVIHAGMDPEGDPDRENTIHKLEVIIGREGLFSVRGKCELFLRAYQAKFRQAETAKS